MGGSLIGKIPCRLLMRDVLEQLQRMELCKNTGLHRPRHSSLQDCAKANCRCGERPLADQPQLAYFTFLPNYGLTHKEPPGGSREP